MYVSVSVAMSVKLEYICNDFNMRTVLSDQSIHDVQNSR
jgi:hypothetical protein